VRLTATDAARIVGGTVLGSGDVLLTGADVDSRRVGPGDLFVALPGARHDGHEFVGQALVECSAALVSERWETRQPPSSRAVIRVSDPLPAYWALARWDRRRRSTEIAAVTGSVGKTTAKDFLAHLVSGVRRTARSEGNRNNTLGLPGQLLSAPEDVQLFVAEAGMSSPGELDTLGGILQPLRLVLYTRIAPVHTEYFPDLEAIVRAKAELLPYLDRDGDLVINGDDVRQGVFSEQFPGRVLRYGGADADSRVEIVEDRGLVGTVCDLILPDGRARVELKVPGFHQVENLLAAATAAFALGADVQQVATAAAELKAAPHRGEVLQLGRGVVLVDDSYNASPVAVERLLELLRKAPGRRVAVLGEMYELGELTGDAHTTVGRQAAAACDLLLAVGGEPARLVAKAAMAAGLRDARHVADAEAATEVLKNLLEHGDVVLVKGSRGVGLDRTVGELVREEAA
jgi:UDP-N-acetylmuramoyl-tripeptide--D-alanyl-D-alanine ligase